MEERLGDAGDNAELPPNCVQAGEWGIYIDKIIYINVGLRRLGGERVNHNIESFNAI